MFLDVRVIVINSGGIRADSTDAELLKCCTEAVFPGECEKRRVVCAVLSGEHFDLGGVFGPKARTIFDVGDDWARACVLILNHLRARTLSKKPKPLWVLVPLPRKDLVDAPLLNALKASTKTTSTASKTAISRAAASTPSTLVSSTAPIPTSSATVTHAVAASTVRGGERRGGSGGGGGIVHPRVIEQEFCRRERWDLERVRLLLKKLPVKHHDVICLESVLDRADKDGFLTVQYKFPKGKSCGRVYGIGHCFQHCTVATRSFCSARFYVEDDMVNAFPTIMSQVFKQAGLSSFLDEYVAKREEVFKDHETDTLTRDVLKNLFLVSLHGGNYYNKIRVFLPFLDRFQLELKSRTRKLVHTPKYSYLQYLANKTNFLGRAIALISQVNESKIMAAKTVFTERSCKVATHLFDGHLREIGALDLLECSKFVEAETGFKVQFETEPPGSDSWVDDTSSPPLSVHAVAPRAPWSGHFFPPHTSTVFSASTPALTSSSSCSEVTTSVSTPLSAHLVTDTFGTSTITVTSPTTATSTSRVDDTSIWARFNEHCPGSVARPPSKYCRVCTDLYLRSKYGFGRSFGERPNVALPKGCTLEALVADIRICGEAHGVRAKLQSLAEALKRSQKSSVTTSPAVSSPASHPPLPSSPASPLASSLPSTQPYSPASPLPSSLPPLNPILHTRPPYRHRRDLLCCLRQPFSLPATTVTACAPCARKRLEERLRTLKKR